MAYIPFIYFTLLFILHMQKSNVRFGAGAMTLLLVDMQSFFSAILDIRNLYGDFGCNPFALSMGGVMLYCVLWTIVLFPILQLDGKDICMEITKPGLFRLLCIVAIVCVGVYVVGTGAIGKTIEKLATTRAEAYEISMDNSQFYQGKRSFWLWIPMIFANASPLCLLLWFLSETIAPQSFWIRIGLLLASSFLMLQAYAGGGRAQLIWYVQIFVIFFAYFANLIPPSKKKMMLVLLAIIGGAAFIGLMSITLSRFDANAADYALDSFVGYAGQNLNNFCACLPYVGTDFLFGDRIAPLTTFLSTGTPYDMKEFYRELAMVYPLQVNVFFTVFGDVLMDIGVIGLGMYLLLYLLFANYLVLPRNNVLYTPQILMFALLVGVPVYGLYSYPYIRTTGTLYQLTLLVLYILFRYSFKYGKRKLI